MRVKVNPAMRWQGGNFLMLGRGSMSSDNSLTFDFYPSYSIGRPPGIPGVSLSPSLYGRRN
jgi:hypothetical protein